MNDLMEQFLLLKLFSAVVDMCLNRANRFAHFSLNFYANVERLLMFSTKIICVNLLSWLFRNFSLSNMFFNFDFVASQWTEFNNKGQSHIFK